MNTCTGQPDQSLSLSFPSSNIKMLSTVILLCTCECMSTTFSKNISIVFSIAQVVQFWEALFWNIHTQNKHECWLTSTLQLIHYNNLQWPPFWVSAHVCVCVCVCVCVSSAYIPYFFEWQLLNTLFISPVHFLLKHTNTFLNIFNLSDIYKTKSFSVIIITLIH